MARSRTRASRVFTISFPEELAMQVDQVAEQESRNLSELFREAFRVYRMERIRRSLDADAAYARTRNPRAYAAGDVERLIREVRAETTVKKRAAK